MQLEQRFEMKASPGELWPYFKDLELLVSCLPGANPEGEIAYADGISSLPLRFEVRLGPIGATFLGKGSLNPNDADLTGEFQGSAVDRKTNSRVSGLAKFSLQAAEPSSGGTIVVVDVDYSLAGSLAQFNRAGIVRQLADTLTSEFAIRLQEKVTAAQSAVTAPAHDTGSVEPPDEPSATGAPETNTALNPAALMSALVRRQWSKLVSKLSGKQSI